MSWKNFGGIQQIKRANMFASTITTDDIILRKSYSGDFNINGSINVNLNATVGKNLSVNGTTTLQDVSMNRLIVNGTSLLKGDTTIPTNLYANNIVANTFLANGNTRVNSQFLLNAYHYLYGTFNGIGLDHTEPIATFDICSNQIAALNLGTSNVLNRNILARNNFNSGIVLGSSSYGNYDIKETSIDFFNANLDISNNGDAYIHSSSKGTLTVKTSTDTIFLSNMIISGSQNIDDISHLSTETVALYDTIIPTEYYFSEVYNVNTHLGKGTAFLSSDKNNVSLSMISLTDNIGCGAKFVGGHYPLTGYSMLSYGVSDNCGNYIPTETIVAGSPTNTKYLATTGINTYMPMTNNYVLDINGPVHIDNGDIVNVKNTNFEILHVKNAIDVNHKNYVMAIGSSTDPSGSYHDNFGTICYRYSVLFSADGGATWKSSVLHPSTLDISNSVLQDNIINQIEVYDCSFAFITGNNNTLIYTYDGGYTWQNINVFGVDNEVNFNALKIKPIRDISNNGISVFFSVDDNLNNHVPSSFAKFDVSFSDITGVRPIGNTLVRYVNTYNTPTFINSIGLSKCKLYVAGEQIIIYDLSNLSVIDTSFAAVSAGFNNYIWSNINVYNDNYAVAIGTGLTRGYDGIYFIDISTSIISVIENKTITNWNSYTSNNYFNTIDYGTDTNGSAQTYKYPMECVIQDIYIYDLSKSIIVGNCKTVNIQGVNITSKHPDGSFIMVSYDGGITWNDISVHFLNASGKSNLLIGSSNIAKNIIIPNINTLLISYTTIPSLFDINKLNCVITGASRIYSCFTPNYLNEQNNHVMDICGNVSISGSLYAKSITCNEFNNLSDYRIKTDISSLNDYSIERLNPVQYTNRLSGKCEWGFIAHELQEELPILVDGVKDGDKYQSINYTGLIALLVKEIQVLKKEIGELKMK